MAVVAIASHFSKEELNQVFHRACHDLDSSIVTELLQLGGDPFWTNSGGITCIISAALSPIEARNKLRVLQSKTVSFGIKMSD